MRSEIRWVRRGEEVKLREREMVALVLGERSEVRVRSFEVCMMEGIGLVVFLVVAMGELNMEVAGEEII
jgi:hypothetical protein